MPIACRVARPARKNGIDIENQSQQDLRLGAFSVTIEHEADPQVKRTFYFSFVIASAKASMSTEEKNNSDQQASASDLRGEPFSVPKIITFDSLARCGDEVWIENSGQLYRLRRTRQGKLILTK